MLFLSTGAKETSMITYPYLLLLACVISLLFVTDDVEAKKKKKTYTQGEDFQMCMKPLLDADSNNVWPPSNLQETSFSVACPPQVVIPSDSLFYDYGRATFNRQYSHHPAAIFYATSSSQVQAAIQCASSLNLKVSPAGRRNSFLSMAVPNGYIVIDLSLMNNLSLDIDKMEAVVGPGVNGPNVQSACQDSEVSGLSAASGVCAQVGMFPWALGGGLGFQGHRLGLGCDSLVELEMVLADGSIVTVNENQNQDLFWASCGGAGGTFGIVTSMTLRLHILPNEGKNFAFYFSYTGKEDFVEGWMRFQDWFPTASRLWGFDLPVLSPAGYVLPLSLTAQKPDPAPRFTFFAYYWGSRKDAMHDLTAAGLNVTSASIVPLGLYPSHQAFYSLTQQPSWNGGAGFASTSNAVGNTAVVNSFGNPWATLATMNSEVATALAHGKEFTMSNSKTIPPVGITVPYSPFAGTDMVGGAFYSLFFYVKNRFVDRLSRTTIENVADFLTQVSAECLSGNLNMCTLQIGGHPLGGAYADREPTETAFFWRKKLILLYFMISSLDGGSVSSEEKDTIDALMELVVPRNSLNQSAYSNYQQETFNDWEYGYFGENYQRLLDIKEAVDPNGLFTKQFTVGYQNTHSKSGKQKSSMFDL
ncbi:hypothetical protein ACHAWF_007693 [Thalassiosira exigua]